MSRGDLLRGALGAGATGFMTSKILKGDGGSPFKNIKENIETSGGLKEMFSPTGRFGAKGDFLPNPKFTDKLRGIFRGTEDVLSPLLDSLQKGNSFKGGMEELQSAIILPMLLQQILGE